MCFISLIRNFVLQIQKYTLMAKKEETKMESILDINSNNIWNCEEQELATLWEQDKAEEGFQSSEEKLLNIMRLAFEVVHYNADDERDCKKYENGEWATFSHVDCKRFVAIRRKTIKRITDLSYENIRHITAATLLDLIDRNFGGGWDSIPLSIKDIIEVAFDVSTTCLPATRLKAAGGTYERKVAAGFDVLEISKGNWTEAIFAKKKEPVEKLRFVSENHYDEDGNLIVDEEDLPEDPMADEEEDEEENDDTFYSSYAAEADVKEEDEDMAGLSME